MPLRLVAQLMGIFLFVCAVAHAQILPRVPTDAERQSMDDSVNTGEYVWECYPDLAGFTAAPPTSSRFPGEFEQTRGILLAFPPGGCAIPEVTDLIRNSIGNVETTVFVVGPPYGMTYYNEAVNCLRSRGFTDDDLAFINWYLVPIMISPAELVVWIRDYGPEILIGADGAFQYIDMGYYSGPAAGTCTNFGGRPNSDVSPTRFAPNFLGGVDVFRPQLRTEGGNLQTDGRGTCVHMQRDVLAQNRFSRWSYSQEQLDAVYTQYFNCQNVITLESLRSDPQPGLASFSQTNIDHVDMFMTFISPTKVLLGQMDPEDAAFDPANAAILDRNAQTMQDNGYNVVRIPMPRRYCTRNNGGCIANPGEAQDCAPGAVRVWATYANSIRIGNKMMVPVYRQVPSSVQDAIAAQEAVALATFQNELDAEYGPGTVQVVPLIGDPLIPCLGSVHCISMTYGPPAAP